MTTGLDRCACKRGFFTLRDCDRPATTTCDLCSRRVCDEHLAPRVQARVCVECAARQAEEAATPSEPPTGAPVVHRGGHGPEAVVDPEQATVRTARYRRRYYDDHGYEPMWWASHDSYWAGDGYRWHDDDLDDDDGGGFGDS